MAIAPSPANSGTTLTVAAGTGALFGTAPFEVTVWPVISQPLSTNAEIIRVTSKGTGDNWTIIRTQEGSSARNIVVGDQIAATITAKTLQDVEGASYSPTAHNVLSAYHGDTLTGNVLDGDIIIGNVTPVWSRLAISVPASPLFNVLGVVNAETRPSWKAVFDGNLPESLVVGGSSAVGSAMVASRRDHHHGFTAWFAPNITLGLAAVEGVGTTIIRPDCTIVAFDATVPTTITVASSAGTGAINLVARRDHAHGITTSSNPGVAAAILASNASGKLTLVDFEVTNTVQYLSGTMILTGGTAFWKRNLTDYTDRRNWAWMNEQLQLGDMGLYVSNDNISNPGTLVMEVLKNGYVGIGKQPVELLDVAGKIRTDVTLNAGLKVVGHYFTMNVSGTDVNVLCE